MTSNQQVFAVPGELIIDIAHDGKSGIYGQTLEEVRTRHPNAIAMTLGEFCKGKAVQQDTPIQWEETTEERYWDMLEVLPPAYMNKAGFLVGEPWDHHAISGLPRFQAFTGKAGKFHAASRPMTVPEFRAATEQKGGAQ